MSSQDDVLSCLVAGIEYQRHSIDGGNRDLAFFRFGYQKGYAEACQAISNKAQDMGKQARKKANEYSAIDLSDSMIKNIIKE